MSEVTVKASSAEISKHLNLDLFNRFTASRWSKLGNRIAKWIREDLTKGVLQGVKDTDWYRSQQYMKYKKNEMRRFTTDTKKGRKKAKSKTKTETFLSRQEFRGEVFYGRYQETTTTKGGKRLKAYYGKTIESTETRHVNLTLTGKMKNSLRPTSADRTGVNIGVMPEHTGKIEGNRRYGREILTLNEKNQDRALKYILDNMIDPALKDFARDKININVKI